MAFYTITLAGDFVYALCLIWDDPFVALKTDLIRIGIEQLPVTGGMRVMASRAFPTLDRCVNELALQFFFEIGMTVQAEFTPCAGFQLEFPVLSISD